MDKDMKTNFSWKDNGKKVDKYLLENSDLSPHDLAEKAISLIPNDNKEAELIISILANLVECYQFIALEDDAINYNQEGGINFYWKDRRVNKPLENSAVIVYNKETGIHTAHYENDRFSHHPADGGTSIDYINYWIYEDELYPITEAV